MLLQEVNIKEEHIEEEHRPMEKSVMTLADLTAVLSANPNVPVHLVLPNGTFVPAHFHVTEVGRVQKDFVDCGGTVRNSVSCVLQVWVAADLDHRLETTKLAGIISKASKLFTAMDCPLEIEYESGLISQYPVLRSEGTPDALILYLGTKHTACLALDRCGVQLNVVSSCSTPGCC